MLSLFGFRLPRLGGDATVAVIALVGVFAQEIVQGLGLYPGTFGPLDFLFDALGVVLAWGLASLVSGRGRADRTARSDSSA